MINSYPNPIEAIWLATLLYKPYIRKKDRPPQRYSPQKQSNRNSKIKNPAAPLPLGIASPISHNCGMTIRAPAVQAPGLQGRSGQRLRLTLWALHVWVVLLALLSLITDRFNLWLDMRALGAAGKLFAILWAATATTIPFLAGPRLTRFFRHPRWSPGLAPHIARLLLWPTYFLLACLLADTACYIDLLLHQKADLQFPLPFLIAILLALWALLTREYLRRQSETTKIDAPTRLLATLWTISLAIFMLGAFALHLFQRPPPPDKKIDLAVVLGGYVLPDSKASVELADRTRVAINLYKQGLVSHILLSGGLHPPTSSHPNERNEITAMKNVCLAEGIPESALFYDPVGINTRATAFNTAGFMHAHGFSSVIVCSTDFHLYRTVLSFHQAGLDAYALAAQPADWQCAEIRDTVREMIGIAVYKLFPHYHQPTVISMQLKSPRLVVKKSAGTLELFDGQRLVKTYPCISGTHPGDKQKEGDRRTPEGTYRIVYKNPESNFHLSLGLDYPNKKDATRGLADGLITQAQYDQITAALASDLSLTENQKNLWYTPLGGEIFIHGHGTGRPDTAGCVALDNVDIDELYALLPVGTPVEIQP